MHLWWSLFDVIWYSPFCHHRTLRTNSSYHGDATRRTVSFFGRKVLPLVAFPQFPFLFHPQPAFHNLNRQKQRERQSGSWSTVKPSRCAIRLSGTTYRPVPCHHAAGRHQSVATFPCKLFFFDFSLSVQLPIRSRRYLISEVIPNDCFIGARGAWQHPRYRLQRVAAGDISVVSF